MVDDKYALIVLVPIGGVIKVDGPLVPSERMMFGTESVATKPRTLPPKLGYDEVV
jgi:hypothetical protein